MGDTMWPTILAFAAGMAGCYASYSVQGSERPDAPSDGAEGIRADDAGGWPDAEAARDGAAPDETAADLPADADSDADGGPATSVWVTIEPGTFLMGSPETEPGRRPNETQHWVTLTHRFEILSTAVAQAQFQDRMGYNPSFFTACGGECPVETVNWHEAAAYCNALSAAAGLGLCYSCSGAGADVTCDASSSYPNPYACPGYRLPTEAEWEFAARAGTTGGSYNGTCDDAHLVGEQPNPVLDSIAWFCGNSGYTTHAFATRDPNPWGLYDMLGNVWEWCHDWRDGGDYPAGPTTDPWGLAAASGRVVRGGSWNCHTADVRATFRDGGRPAMRVDSVGFRPSRSLEP